MIVHRHSADFWDGLQKVHQPTPNFPLVKGAQPDEDYTWLMAYHRAHIKVVGDFFGMNKPLPPDLRSNQMVEGGFDSKKSSLPCLATY